MNNYFLKINSIYLDGIRRGNKKHEYRLGDSKLSNVSIGDILTLVDKTNDSNFLRVVVISTESFPNWNLALSKYWSEDFKNTYKTLDEAVNACQKFYQKSDVDKYGIKVIGIKMIDEELSNKTFLLDTNIFIQRENDKNCLQDITLMYSYIDKINGIKLISNETISELNKHSDKQYKENMLVKTKAYKCINLSNCDDINFLRVCQKSTSTNDDIDNMMLSQVYMNKVDYLITQDRGILYKASKLFIRNWVLTPSEFLDRFSKLHPKLKEYDALSIELKQFSDIDINDDFFSSLKEDYGAFDFTNWFKKKAAEPAYVFYKNNKLQGFLFLKVEGKNEKYDDLEPKLKPCKRLKVGTFKVNSTGIRLGERFIKIIFDNAVMSQVDEIYVTMYENKRKEVQALIALLSKWGFVKSGVKKHGIGKPDEIYMVKKLNFYDDNKSAVWNFPNIKQNRQFGILPIKMQYHNKLFPDLHVRFHNENIYDLRASSYALEKIYVCQWFPSKLSKGDELMVYMMSDIYKKYKSAITGSVILSDVYKPKSVIDLIRYCKNISIFSNDELANFYQTKRNIVAIKILQYKSFVRKVNNATLMEKKILSNELPPRISTILNLEKYNHIIKLSQSTQKVEKHEKSNTNINKAPIR